MLRGRFRGISEEKMMRCLVALGETKPCEGRAQGRAFLIEAARSSLDEDQQVCVTTRRPGVVESADSTRQGGKSKEFREQGTRSTEKPAGRRMPKPAA